MRRHEANPTALIAGVLYIGLGCYALAVGPDRLNDALRWMWPILLLGLGVALLAGSSRREHRSRDEVGAERSEDGEVEQSGGGHDSGVGAFL